jgi:hypothetical protein
MFIWRTLEPATLAAVLAFAARRDTQTTIEPCHATGPCSANAAKAEPAVRRCLHEVDRV